MLIQYLAKGIYPSYCKVENKVALGHDRVYNNVSSKINESILEP
jgi:hypothetical protein